MRAEFEVACGCAVVFALFAPACPHVRDTYVACPDGETPTNPVEPIGHIRSAALYASASTSQV